MNVNYSLVALYVITVVTAIAVPGPVALLVAGAGLQGGPGKALQTIVGTNSASLILILLSALVMKGLFAVNEIAFGIVKIAGACYIAYMGWGMLRGAGSQERGEQTVKPHIGGFTKGFVMAISNPKDIIFFASFFPQFIGITGNTNTSLAVLTGLWIALDFSTLMLVYLLVSKLIKPTVHEVLLRVSGLLLIVIAIGGILVTALSLYHPNGLHAG